VDDDEKLLPFGEASPGATGLELLLSLALKWSEEAGRGDGLLQAIAKISAEPARVADLAGGRLEAGAPADICVFDPEARWTVKASALASQGKHTPFLGYELRGQVRHTIVAGQVVYSRP
jgi:dihydroorotase